MAVKNELKDFREAVTAYMAAGGGSAVNFTLKVASSTELGGIKVGEGLKIDKNGKLDVTVTGGSSGVALVPASSSVLGGIKVGTGLEMDENNKLNLAFSLSSLSLATSVSGGLMSSEDKTKLNGIAANANNYSLPTATASKLGGIKVGTGLEITSGVLSVKGNTIVLDTTPSAQNGGMWYVF